jgi:hypothetical protein
MEWRTLFLRDRNDESLLSSPVPKEAMITGWQAR